MTCFVLFKTCLENTMLPALLRPLEYRVCKLDLPISLKLLLRMVIMTHCRAPLAMCRRVNKLRSEKDNRFSLWLDGTEGATMSGDQCYMEDAEGKISVDARLHWRVYPPFVLYFSCVLTQLLEKEQTYWDPVQLVTDQSQEFAFSSSFTMETQDAGKN